MARMEMPVVRRPVVGVVVVRVGPRRAATLPQERLAPGQRPAVRVVRVEVVARA